MLSGGGVPLPPFDDLESYFKAEPIEPLPLQPFAYKMVAADVNSKRLLPAVTVAEAGPLSARLSDVFLQPTSIRSEQDTAMWVNKMFTSVLLARAHISLSLSDHANALYFVVLIGINHGDAITVLMMHSSALCCRCWTSCLPRRCEQRRNVQSCTHKRPLEVLLTWGAVRMYFAHMKCEDSSESVPPPMCADKA